MPWGFDNDIAIRVAGLAKRFGVVQALAGVDFNVRSGELYGFLGPNGAGKTTTINILTGLARADAGTIHIGGIDCSNNPRAAQRLVGVVPDESNLYAELSGFDNLCFCAALYGMAKPERRARALRLLEIFDLVKAADRKFGTYSKGMKRKLTIAAGIIHRPAILFLDEPTTGIDVGSARQLRRLIAELNQQGTTIFLTTHYIEEAERLCDRIAFITGGRIVKVDTVDNLLQPVRAKHVLQISLNSDSDVGNLADDLARAFPGLQFFCSQSRVIRVEATVPVHVGPLVRFLEEKEAEVSEVRKIRPSLEDVFVEVTGIGADAMGREKEKKGGGQ